MDKYKTILNLMLDLGGLATKNNFYSPKAKTVLGSLVSVRKTFDELESKKLIQPLSTVTRVRNLTQEQFFAITKKGAKFVGRTKDHKWKGSPKSPYNIMHESMVRDVALAFIRNNPDYTFYMSYKERIYRLRPDIVVRMTHKISGKQLIYLVEVERKKTVDRVYKEKLLKYENVFSELNFRKYNLNAPVKVLIVYSNLDFNCFLRPQEYGDSDVKTEIQKLQKQVLNLKLMSKDLPKNRYIFVPFCEFSRIN